MPKGSPGVKRRPKTQAEKDHQRDMIRKRWQDPAYRNRVSAGLNEYWQEQEHHDERRNIANEIAATAEWRKNVSEGTKRAHATPEVKARLKAGLAKAMIDHGVPFFGGDTGDVFASILCPVGYVREYRVYYGEPVVRVFGRDRFRRKNLSLDFAHVEGKINIELDGPGHRIAPMGDVARDALLRDLGWRIIRIRHA
jgi:hypothetical protein